MNGRFQTRGLSLSLVLVVYAVAVTACESTPVRPVADATAEDLGLVAWADAELAPYLAQQLTQHPRFKGEPVLLVAVSGADVLPDIDQLTRTLRSRLMDTLLEKPGPNLVWRPSAPPWRHHRRQEQADCRDSSEIHYYIGIEISPVPGGEVRVRVRALDLRDETWVTGFGKHWQGTLSLAQSRAWAERHPDEHLRGLRVLPFGEHQADLVAAYLARNLSCLLRGRPDDERLVHVAIPQTGDPQVRTVLELVGNYLARFRAVQITEDSSRASLVLRGKHHQIRPDLQQVWVSLRSQESDESVDTAAYLRAAALTSEHRTAGVSMSGAESAPQPLLSPLRMVRLPASSACASRDRKRHAAALHEEDPAAETDHCIALQFEISDGAQIVLLSHRPDTGLRRLFPAGCRDASAYLRRGSTRNTFTFPTAAADLSALQTTPGQETFYAIGIADGQLGGRLQAHLNALSSDCETDWQPTDGALQGWLTQLDTLLQAHPEQTDWQALRVGYEP